MYVCTSLSHNEGETGVIQKRVLRKPLGLKVEKATGSWEKCIRIASALELFNIINLIT
jgi:hypothetical protein